LCAVVNMFQLLLLTLLSTYTSVSDKRMLLIFADKASNPALKEQMQTLKADTKGLAERDVEIHTYYGDRDVKMFQDKKIRSNYTVILVGKDGGDKMRATSPVTLKTLFSTIDEMPMRQVEMARVEK
jgi:hypothetical protein